MIEIFMCIMLSAALNVTAKNGRIHGAYTRRTTYRLLLFEIALGAVAGSSTPLVERRPAPTNTGTRAIRLAFVVGPQGAPSGGMPCTSALGADVTEEPA